MLVGFSKGSPMLQGSAGQSFACFMVAGMKVKLVGEANDYVGKGIAGGEVVIVPPPKSRFAADEASLVGNTCLYGATGGRLFVNGRAGGVSLPPVWLHSFSAPQRILMCCPGKAFVLHTNVGCAAVGNKTQHGTARRGMSVCDAHDDGEHGGAPVLSACWSLGGAGCRRAVCSAQQYGGGCC